MFSEEIWNINGILHANEIFAKISSLLRYEVYYQDDLAAT